MKGKKRKFKSKASSVVIAILFSFLLSATGNFLFSKLFTIDSNHWEIKMHEIGGQDFRNDNFILYDDGRITLNGELSEIRAAPEKVAKISTLISDCDLRNSVSVPLPEFNTEFDKVHKSLWVTFDGVEFRMPDYFVNPIREIAYIELQIEISQLYREIKYQVEEK